MTVRSRVDVPPRVGATGWGARAKTGQQWSPRGGGENVRRPRTYVGVLQFLRRVPVYHRGRVSLPETRPRACPSRITAASCNVQE
jgi:hypothetical protein